jgi:DNA repair exonuclease SbcCD ATPase subunit
MKAAIEKVVETLETTRAAQEKAREAKGHHDALAAELKLLRQRIDKLPEKSAARERLAKEYTQQEEQLDKFLKAMREAGDAAIKAERDRDAVLSGLSAK